MVKRVKAKRFGILKIADDFHKSRQDLALKLSSQLGIAPLVENLYIGQNGGNWFFTIYHFPTMS